MRVAMVGLRAPGAEGGIEQAVSELAPRLVARGCEVTVFCRRRWNSLGSRWKGVELVDVPTLYTKHLETLLYTAAALPLAARDFDVVHIHAIGPAALSWIPRLAGRATVVTAHGLDWRRDKWGPAARLVLRMAALSAAASADRLIAVSAETAQWFHDLGVPADRVPNGVSEIARAPLDAAGVAGLRPGYVLYLGRLVPEKSVETLIDAHRRADTGRQLVITGSPSHTQDYADALKRRAGPGVVFTGSRHGDAKAALLHHAGAVAFPSRLEGLPITLLEAMICGRGTFVSDIPPHREVADGTAVVLPVGDVKAWSKALADLDRLGLEQLGAAGRQRALDHFGWDPVADHTLDVYRRALARRTAAKPATATLS